MVVQLNTQVLKNQIHFGVWVGKICQKGEVTIEVGRGVKVDTIEAGSGDFEDGGFGLDDKEDDEGDDACKDEEDAEDDTKDCTTPDHGVGPVVWPQKAFFPKARPGKARNRGVMMLLLHGWRWGEEVVVGRCGFGGHLGWRGGRHLREKCGGERPWCEVMSQRIGEGEISFLYFFFTFKRNLGDKEIVKEEKEAFECGNGGQSGLVVLRLTKGREHLNTEAI